MKGNKLSISLFIIGCLFWIITYSLIAPQHAGTDFFIFKDSGVNLALGKGFTEVTTPDNPSLSPKLYSAYPPLYALIYSLYTMTIGFGAYENTYFNLGLGMLWSSTLFWLITKRFSVHLSNNQKLLFSICCVLLIPVTPTFDRPENMVLLFFFLSLLSAYTNSSYGFLSTFFFIGASFVTSPFGGLANFIFICTFLISEYSLLNKKEFSNKQFYLKAITGSLIAPGIWFFSYIIRDPDAFFRLFIHGTQKGGLTQFLNFLTSGNKSHYINSFAHISGVGLFHGISFFVIFIISHFVPIVFFANRFIKTHQKQNLIYSGIFSSVFAGSVILFPAQINYMWILSVMCTVLFLILVCSDEAYLITWPLLSLIILTLVCQPRTLRDIYTRALLHDSYYEAMLESSALSKMISGKHVSINPLQYFALKPYAIVGRDNYCDAPTENYDYVAVGYHDFNPGELVYPNWFDKAKYDLVYKPNINKFAPKTKLDQIMLRPTDLWQFALYKKR